MNGSRSAISIPAKARRTGKPSPSRPRGAVVMVLIRRARLCVLAPTTLGSSKGFLTEIAGMDSAYWHCRGARLLLAREHDPSDKDAQSEHHRHVPWSPVEAMPRARYAEPVGVRSAQWTGEDVTHPECCNAVKARH